MTLIASVWLALALLLCGFAWVSTRRTPALTLPVMTVLAALAMYVPLGQPQFTAPPPGNYTVVGAKIVVPTATDSGAIYVLLDSGSGEPIYYVLPYSPARAGDLQGALDGEGEAFATVGENGGVRYDGEPPVSGDAPKEPDQPAFTIGG
jgi:hypothetical protein